MRRPLSPPELGFTAPGRNRLRQALAAADDVRPFRRLQAVLPAADGSAFASAAAVTGLSVRTACHSVGRYLAAHSVAALHEQARPGRPPPAVEITARRIPAELSLSPPGLGYRANVRTAGLLAERLNRRCQCSISPRAPRAAA
jgi:hypothetical protein